MDLSFGLLTSIRLVAKYIAHTYQQSRATTHEFKVVHTSYGQVKGRKRKNVYREHDKFYAFEGIPYAKPPLGELRFRDPQPAEPWSDVLDCTNCKSKPMQYNYVAKWVEGSEDCLYLNVYSKKLNSEKPLPVMVWIYGGGFQIGEASRHMYAPDYLMQRDVVLVTFNYRLGIFGFLCLDDPELNIPGNAGLKDQVLALRWIKENVHNFNGDPNNITLFGESAGGVSTQFMMLTPQARGLFHKAIIQSGSVLCSWAYTDGHDWGYKFACHIGYKGDSSDKSVYKYLMSRKSKKLTLRDISLMTKDDLHRHLIVIFRPVVEPYITENCVASKPFRELLANAWGNEIPLMIGGNSSEGLLHYKTVRKRSFLINELSDFVNLLPDDVQRTHSDDKLKEMGLRLKEVYFGGQQPNAKDNFFQYLELLGHRTIWHGVFRSIRARSEYATNVPTYCYLFDFDSEFFNHFRTLSCGHSVRGVCHADDLPYLFYNTLSQKLSSSSKEYRCIQRMTGLWYNFALTSNPNCAEISPVLWKPVADFRPPLKCLAISDDVEFKDLPVYDQLSVWDQFYTKEDLI